VLRKNAGEIAGDLGLGTKLVAGTAWLFSRPDLDQRLDYLVIDEAGQLSLANACAVGTAARNLILVGDPRQLSQPSQGTHPPGADASALDHVLGSADTMPENLGIFMDHTRRLHPEICSFISELAYEGRLTSIPECENQTIEGTGFFSGSGLRWVPVEHHSNKTSSPEEAEEVARIFSELGGRVFVNGAGQTGWLGSQEILVVAPYNAQVSAIGKVLGPNARVGTVDKFQGQEAPVVIVSLTTSSPEDISRGMEFLYSRSRLNVAVSRAQCLAIIVGSPALLAIACRTVKQLRLANGLCRFVEMASVGE
jgi:uncharacterized protein